MHTYSIVGLAALRLRKFLEALGLVTVTALNLDELAAGALDALRVSGDSTLPRDLPAHVRLLLLAKVGGVVVLQAHVALELVRERNAP